MIRMNHMLLQNSQDPNAQVTLTQEDRDRLYKTVGYKETEPAVTKLPPDVCTCLFNILQSIQRYVSVSC